MPANLKETSRELCKPYVAGKCTSTTCVKVHPENGDPKLQGTMGDMIDNEPGKACTRCLNMGIPCDKPGRGGEDDPCSECRWFGGPNVRCAIVPDKSYNSTLYQMMVGRGLEYNLTLATPKNRDPPPPNPGQTDKRPKPILESRLKDDYECEDRDVLIREARDLLTQEQRQCPRAHLTPAPPQNPRVQAKATRAIAKHGMKRKAEPATAALPQKAHKMMLPPSPLPVPQPVGNGMFQAAQPTGYAAPHQVPFLPHIDGFAPRTAHYDRASGRLDLSYDAMQTDHQTQLVVRREKSPQAGRAARNMQPPRNQAPANPPAASGMEIDIEPSGQTAASPPADLPPQRDPTMDDDSDGPEEEEMVLATPVVDIAPPCQADATAEEDSDAPLDDEADEEGVAISEQTEVPRQADATAEDDSDGPSD